MTFNSQWTTLIIEVNSNIREKAMTQTQNHNAGTIIQSRLSNEQTSERLSAPSFRIFLGVADKWDLKVQERITLLGGISEATYYNWKKEGVTKLDHDQLERLSLLLGIWKGMRLLFANPDSGIKWLKANNRDLPFGGQSPLSTMLRGSIDDLYAVRRYLDGWRGVWP